MSENALSPEQPSTNIVAAASEGVQQGAADAAAAASESTANHAQFFSKAVYNTFYYSSYYVTFAALTVAKALPLDNAAGHGMHDGAVAARDALQKADEQAAVKAAAQPVAVHTEGLAPA